MIEDKVHDEINPFSIWTRAYEERFDIKNNFELKSFSNDQDIPRHIDVSNNGVINYGESSNKSNIEEILEKYRDSPGFSAMQLGDREELFEHVKIIYDLMYKHYILGKKNDSTFPSYECCPSAQNLMVAGLGMGYPNASVLDSDHDHCYTAFPFLLGEEKGFIVADPTSDQLWHGSVRPRNHIFVAKHGDWEYKTNWASGHDLYPDNYINLDSLKKNKNNWCSYNSDIDGFFDRVFENPVSVSINKS